MSTYLKYNFWYECLKSLEKSLGPEMVKNLFRTITVEIDGNEVKMFVPDKATLQKIKNEYLDKIKEVVSEVSPEARVVSLFLKKAKNLKDKHIIEPFEIDTLKRFEGFVSGKSNEFAFNLAKKIGDGDFKDLGLTIFCGSFGLGKTHLLQSIAFNLIHGEKDCRVCLIHSEKFVVDMVAAIQDGTTKEFRKSLRDVDIFLVDDCHFFINKKRSQYELAELIHYLRNQSKPVVMSLDRHPDNIEDVSSRLKSFFQWSVVANLNPPDLSARIKIIENKVAEYSKTIGFTKEVNHYIAKKCRSNVREIEGVLKRLYFHSHYLKAPVTLEFVKKSLGELDKIKLKKITPLFIQKAVCTHFSVELKQLTGDGRRRSIVKPRQIAMHLIRKHTKYSLPEIGSYFNKRDHATVIYSCKKIDGLLKSNEYISNDYKQIEDDLFNS